MQPGSKHLIVWGLYAAGISTLVTPFVGVMLAHHWRRDADPVDKARHDRQIRLFWRTGMAWAVGVALIGLALYLDIQSGAPAGSDKPLLFSVGLLVGIVAQIGFTLISLWHLVRTLFGGGVRPQPA